MDATTELVIFELDERAYAVELNHVQRVIRAVDTTPLPGAPATVLGAIDVHGTLIAVFNIRARLGIESRPLRLTDQFIIVRAAKRTVALAVDGVRDIARVASQDIVPPATVLPGWNAIQGVLPLGSGLILIQDLDRFLSLEEDLRLEAALAGEAHDGG